jgi:hypothetical protein
MSKLRLSRGLRGQIGTLGAMWLWEGIISNLVTVAVILGGGGGIYWLTGRRRAKRFFHLGPRGIVVYASQLNVVAGGSTGCDGQPRNYAGRAMAENELNCVNAVERFFSRFRPTWSPLSGPMSRIGLRWRDTAVSGVLAPPQATGIDRGPTIFAIGSPAYNTASGLVEASFPTLARFSSDYHSIEVQGAGSTTDLSAFIVERGFDVEAKTCAFYAAGFTPAATAEAIDYLLGHWKELYRRYGATRSYARVMKSGPAGAEAQLLFEAHQ